VGKNTKKKNSLLRGVNTKRVDGRSFREGGGRGEEKVQNGECYIGPSTSDENRTFHGVGEEKRCTTPWRG